MQPVCLKLNLVKLESMMTVSDMGPKSYCGFLPPLPFVESLLSPYMLKFICDISWLMLDNLFLFVVPGVFLRLQCYNENVIIVPNDSSL